MLIGRYTAQRAGIESHQDVRGITPIRGGEVAHTGVIPSKKFEATVRCCTQNGVRGGPQFKSFLALQEIEDIPVEKKKNNKGTEDNLYVN